MKVHILFTFTTNPWGGGNQFLKTLKKYFLHRGCYVEHPDEADVLLINSHHKIQNVLALKRLNEEKIVIHRVDGPIQVVRGRETGIDKTIYLLNRVAIDATIFQSDWSRYQNYDKGLVKNHFEITIMNAPDPVFFNREGKIPFARERKVRLISTSWSSNWRKGFKVYQWLDNHLDFNRYEMTFVGNSPIKFQNIRCIPPLKSDILASELKKHDIYVTASQNDPCSNSLIEAIHCGLPCLALNEGGHPEIIGDGGVLFSQKEEVHELLDLMVQNYTNYQSRIKLPNFDYIGQKYYDFLFSIYDAVQRGVYMPKRMKTEDYIRVLFALLRWKVIERYASLKTHFHKYNHLIGIH